MDIWVHAIQSRNSEALGAPEHAEGFMAGFSGESAGITVADSAVNDYLTYLFGEIKAYPSRPAWQRLISGGDSGSRDFCIGHSSGE
jgi:hypothetical protein